MILIYCISNGYLFNSSWDTSRHINSAVNPTDPLLPSLKWQLQVAFRDEMFPCSIDCFCDRPMECLNQRDDEDVYIAWCIVNVNKNKIVCWSKRQYICCKTRKYVRCELITATMKFLYGNDFLVDNHISGGSCIFYTTVWIYSRKCQDHVYLKWEYQSTL